MLETAGGECFRASNDLAGATTRRAGGAGTADTPRTGASGDAGGYSGAGGTIANSIFSRDVIHFA